MKNAMRLFLTTIVLAPCLLNGAAAANSITYTVGGLQITLTDLGVLAGGTASRALAINNVGQIAGLANDSSFALQRPIWNAGTGAIIGAADNWDPASTAVPEHRNDHGEMVGSEVIRNGTLYEGVYWNAAGQAFGLPPMAGVDPLYGAVHVYGHGINNRGQMVGASKDSTLGHFLHAVLWQNKDTPPQDLGFLGRSAYGTDYSEAYGINDSTHVVGNSAIGTVIHGFLWRDGHMLDLSPTSAATSASAINNNGLIVGKSNLDPVGWRYDVTNSSSTPVMQRLPIPSGFFTAQPTSVNDLDDVAGYAGSPNIDAHAILWRNGQAFDLGIWPGGHYSVANGINNLGQIVGTGTVAGDNLDHALMWTVVVGGGGGGGGTTTTNQTPVVRLQATSPVTVRVGGSLSVQASFTDPDNGPWSYMLDWGDGSMTTGNTSTTGTIAAIRSHAYASSGSFTARLTVTDGKRAAGTSNTITVRVR